MFSLFSRTIFVGFTYPISNNGVRGKKIFVHFFILFLFLFLLYGL